MPEPGFDSAPLVAAIAPDLHELLLAGGPEVVSLGVSADGAVLVVLRALRAARRRPRYRPVDAEPAALARAVDAARGEGFASEGVLADPGDAAVLDALKAPPGAGPRLVLLLGDRLGGAAPEPLASELRRLLRRGDHLLVDAAPGAGERLRRLLVEVAALDVVRELGDGRALLWLARPSA